MRLCIDLTEFLGNPIRTGIQRLSGRICKHLPDSAAIPVRVSEGRLFELDPALIKAVASYFDKEEGALQEIRRLGPVERGREIRPSCRDVVLVPDVFDNLEHLSFFRTMSEHELERCRFVVYDLLPMTHPQYFGTEGVLNIHAYYQVLRRASTCGFISEQTRETYFKRLKRTSERDGVVLPLGSDSLGPRPPRMCLHRPLRFSVIGTIEPRKNHALILEAFEPLLGEVKGLELVFVGRIGWVDSRFAAKIDSLVSDPYSGFRFLAAPDDAMVRECIEQSRATVYVSAAEGYGLPPVESLWLRTPVIASKMIPSLHAFGSAGVRCVDPLNVLNLRRAILDFTDDEYANQKAAETEGLDLPTWSSFAQRVFEWCGLAIDRSTVS